MSNNTGNQAYTPDDEIDLASILNQLSENRWLILIVTLFALAAGVFYSSRQIPQYQSDVLLQIESGQSSFGQTGGMSQQFMFRSTGSDATSTQTALMQSRYILEPVIQSLGLDISVSPKRGSAWSWVTSLRKKTAQVALFEVPRKLINHSFNLVFDKPDHVSVYNSAGYLLLQGPVGTLITSTDKTFADAW